MSGSETPGLEPAEPRRLRGAGLPGRTAPKRGKFYTPHEGVEAGDGRWNGRRGTKGKNKRGRRNIFKTQGPGLATELAERIRRRQAEGHEGIFVDDYDPADLGPSPAREEVSRSRSPHERDYASPSPPRDQSRSPSAHPASVSPSPVGTARPSGSRPAPTGRVPRQIAEPFEAPARSASPASPCSPVSLVDTEVPSDCEREQQVTGFLLQQCKKFEKSESEEEDHKGEFGLAEPVDTSAAASSSTRRVFIARPSAEDSRQEAATSKWELLYQKKQEQLRLKRSLDRDLDSCDP